MILTLPDYAGLVLDLRPSPNGSVTVTGPLAHRPWPFLGVLAERVRQALACGELAPVSCWHEGELVWIRFVPRKNPFRPTRKQKKAGKPRQRTLFEEES